jgi:hypothetical protein
MVSTDVPLTLNDVPMLLSAMRDTIRRDEALRKLGQGDDDDGSAATGSKSRLFSSTTGIHESSVVPAADSVQADTRDSDTNAAM